MSTLPFAFVVSARATPPPDGAGLHRITPRIEVENCEAPPPCGLPWKFDSATENRAARTDIAMSRCTTPGRCPTVVDMLQVPDPLDNSGDLPLARCTGMARMSISRRLRQRRHKVSAPKLTGPHPSCRRLAHRHVPRTRLAGPDRDSPTCWKRRINLTATAFDARLSALAGQRYPAEPAR